MLNWVLPWSNIFGLSAYNIYWLTDNTVCEWFDALERKRFMLQMVDLVGSNRLLKDK